MIKIIAILILIPSITLANPIPKVAKSIALLKTDEKQGSGVVISPDGLILTNIHVLTQGKFVTVELNGITYTGVIQKVSLYLDIALVKIPASNLPYVNIKDSKLHQQGDEVWTIGSPLNMKQVASKGIISSFVDKILYTYITTDAIIVEGSSGGGLFNKEGDLIGIVTAAIKDRNRHYSGFGYAISSNDWMHLIK